MPKWQKWNEKGKWLTLSQRQNKWAYLSAYLQLKSVQSDECKRITQLWPIDSNQNVVVGSFMWNYVCRPYLHLTWSLSWKHKDFTREARRRETGPVGFQAPQRICVFGWRLRYISKTHVALNACDRFRHPPPGRKSAVNIRFLPSSSFEPSTAFSRCHLKIRISACRNWDREQKQSGWYSSATFPSFWNSMRVCQLTLNQRVDKEMPLTNLHGWRITAALPMFTCNSSCILRLWYFFSANQQNGIIQKLL